VPAPRAHRRYIGCGLERGESVGVPAALVEGLHEQPPRVLPFRMLCHDRLQGGHRVLDGPHRQHEFGTLFPRRHPQLIQPDYAAVQVGNFQMSGSCR